MGRQAKLIHVTHRSPCDLRRVLTQLARSFVLGLYQWVAGACTHPTAQDAGCHSRHCNMTSLSPRLYPRANGETGAKHTKGGVCLTNCSLLSPCPAEQVTRKVFWNTWSCSRGGKDPQAILLRPRLPLDHSALQRILQDNGSTGSMSVMETSSP